MAEITIRKAKRQDINLALELMLDAYLTYYRFTGPEGVEGFKDEPFRDDYFQRFFLNHVIRPELEAFVAEPSNSTEPLEPLETIAGIMLVKKVPVDFSPSFVARDSMWWIAPEFRNYKNMKKFVELFEEWGRSVKCKYAILSHMHDVRVEKLYARIGYTPFETHCIKRLAASE